MFSKDWRVRIEDMLEALDRIRRYTATMSEEEFCADERTLDAVVRNMEIIGEAARHTPADIAARHPQVPWSRLAEIRNVLVHEYHSVDPRIVWSTLRHDLPPLAGLLRAVLQMDPARP